MKKKKGQFLIITSLLMAIILASLVAYVYNSQTYYLHFRQGSAGGAVPVNNIVEAVVADFKRALAFILANATRIYLNKSYGPSARHNFSIGRAYAYEFLSKWKVYIMYTYKDVGLQVDFETPNKTITLHDRVRKITNLIKCFWYTPESLSMAYAMLKINITGYNFYGWKANITVGLRAWIIEDSFKSDEGKNETAFMIRILYDNNTQYTWLKEKGNITIYYPDPIRYGEWLPANIKHIQYLGNGVYNITIEPYLKLFQGTEHSAAPLKVILEDERGIIVQLYSYKWIQLKIKRNTPDTLYAVEEPTPRYRWNFDIIIPYTSDCDWDRDEEINSDVYGFLTDIDPISDGDKLLFRVRKTGGSYGIASLYSPVFYYSTYKSDGEFIEYDKKVRFWMSFDTNNGAGFLTILLQLSDGSTWHEYTVGTYTQDTEKYVEISIRNAIYSLGIQDTFNGLVRFRFKITAYSKWKWVTLKLDDFTFKVYASRKIPEIYTLDFDWYLNLHWNGVNLGLTDIVWDFKDRLEGWFVVPEQPINISIFGIYFSLHAIEADLESSGDNLILEFYKHPDFLGLNLPYEVWLNLYSPAININRERLDEYQNLTIRYRVDPNNDPSTSIILRLQYLDKETLEPVNLVWDDFPGEIELDSTEWKELTWNFSKCKNLPSYKIITIWIDIFAKTKSGSPQKLYIDYVKMPTKRSLVVPVPSIPLKQFRVNMSCDGVNWDIIPSQFEIWNDVYWNGWKVSEPKGLADFQVNFNSSNRIVFQLSFGYSEREKYVRIWWNDDLDSQPIEWPSEINVENNFVTTNNLGVRFVDENNPIFYEFDETGWNWNGVAALIVEKKIGSNFKTIGLYDLHAYSIYNGLGARRPKGTWNILSIEYPSPYNYMKAPIRALAILKTDKVGPPWDAGSENMYYSTFSIVSVTDNVFYVPVYTRVYWLSDKSIMDSSLTAYWLYIVSSKVLNDMFFELQRKNNYTKAGEFEDIHWNLLYLSYVETVRNAGFLSSEWNNTISLSVVSNIGTLRTQNIFYMNSGGYPLGDHPPPFLLARKESKYYIESLLKAPRASLSILLEIKKNTALFFPTVIRITSHAEGRWVYHYLFTPMFLEPYMPTFEVSVPSP